MSLYVSLSGPASASASASASPIPFDAHPINFGNRKKLYRLAPSIIAEYRAIDPNGLDAKTQQTFREFIEGRYLNIEHLEQAASDIIRIYAWVNPEDLEPLSFLLDHQVNNSWELETEKQRVKRRSPDVKKFWETIAQDAQARRSPTIFYSKPKQEETSPISIVAIKEDQTVAIPLPKRASEKVACRPINYEDSDSDDSSSEVMAIRDKNQIKASIQRIIDRNLRQIENLKPTINVGHDKNKEAKKALVGICELLEGVNSRDYLNVEQWLDRNLGYQKIMRFAGKGR